jgi:hypothetical protein
LVHAVFVIWQTLDLSQGLACLGLNALYQNAIYQQLCHDTGTGLLIVCKAMARQDKARAGLDGLVFVVYSRGLGR